MASDQWGGAPFWNERRVRSLSNKGHLSKYQNGGMELGNRVSHEDIWESNIPDRRKQLKVTGCLMCVKKFPKVSGAE